MPKKSEKNLPDSMRGFAERLKLARKSCGLTLAQVEARSGVSASVVSRAENSKRVDAPMQLVDAVRLAELYEMRLDWLLRGEGPMGGRLVTVLVEHNADSASLRAELLREIERPDAAARETGRGRRDQAR